MGRTVVLLILFILLGAGTIWYLGGERSADKTTLLGADRAFAVENTASIHKIFLADRNGRNTTLERKEDYWIYNQKYRARDNAINNILDAIKRVQIKYKPPQAAVKDMINSLATEGIKVELYGADNKLIKAYYVGGSTADETGTFMIMEGAEQPYVSSIPGWQGNIRFRYNLKGDEWREKSVFMEEAEQIKSVSIEYPRQRSKSFRLEKQDKGYEIRPLFDITSEINAPYKKGSAESFLIGFERLMAEAFINNHEKKDSIRNLIPFAIISLTNLQEETKIVKFFPKYLEGEIDRDTGGFTGKGIVERYYVDCGNGDFMIAQHRLLKKVLWAYEFFYD